MQLIIKQTSSTSATLESWDNDVLVSSQPCKLTKDTLAFELPSNELGRKWVMISKLTKNGGSLELTPHIERAKSSDPVERKPLESYLNEEDRALYLELVAKAKANREAANKKVPMTDLEKAKAAVAKYQAIIDKLQGNA